MTEMDIDQFVKQASWHVDQLLDLIDLSHEPKEAFEMSIEIGVQLITTALMAYRNTHGECGMNDLTETVISEIYRRIDSGLDAESFNQQ